MARHSPVIRRAKKKDLDALVRIEECSFLFDRFSRRVFRYLLSRAKAITLIAVGRKGDARGYVTVLFSRGSSLARLYSIAVDPDHRGRRLGSALLAAAEKAARDRDAATMRLEVREDDPATQAFYRRHGYRPFGVHARYYEDATGAVRMEKSLAPRPDPRMMRVPYYPQSLEFTCGPAALLMAMRALDSAVRLERSSELALWRESTTIYMTAGHGGCSPQGMALAAWRRGFDVELHVSDPATLFVDSVRSERKKQVIRVVQQDFIRQIAKTPIRVVPRPLSLPALRQAFEAGGVPIVLVSSYRFDRSKQPHWVVVTGFDQKYVYLHDPNLSEDDDRSLVDCMQIPVPQRDFARMARYGKSRQQAALVIRKRGV